MAFDTSIFGEEYASIKDEEQAGASVGAISVSQQQQNRDPVADLFGDDYGAAPASAAGVDPVADMFGEDYAAPSLPQQQAAVVTPETQAASQQALADKFKHPADLAAEQQVSAQINPDRSVWENAKLAWGRGKEDYTLKTMAADAIISGDQKATEEYLSHKKEYERLASVDPVVGKNFLEKAIYGAAGSLPGMLQGLKTRAAWQLGGAAAGAGVAALGGILGPQAATPEEAVTVPAAAWAGAKMGAKIGGLIGSADAGKDWWKYGVADFYADMIDSGVDAQTARTASMIGAAPYALIEMAQLDRLAPGMGKLTKEMAKKSVGSTIARFGIKYIQNVLIESSEDGLQQITKDITENMAKEASGLAADKLGLPEVAKRGLESFIQSIGPMMLIVLPGTVAETSATGRGAQAEATTDQVTDQALEKPAAPATPQQAALETLKNKGVAKEAATLTAKQTPEMQRVSELSKTTVGKEIIFVDGLEQNGLYDPEQPDKIFIDSKAENPMVVVFGHEATHGIKQDDPESYNELRNVVVNEIGADGWNKWVARRKEQAAAGRAFDEADLEGNQEEFIADFVGENAGKKSFWQGVYDKSPRAFRALIDIVNKMWVKLKSGTKTFKAKEGYDTAQFFQSVEGLERARNMAMEVMRRQMERRYGFRMRADAGAPEFTGTTREQFQAERPVREGEGLVPYYGQYAQTSRALRPESADARRKVEASIKAELDAKTYRELVTEAKKLGMTKFPLNTKGLREAITMARKFIEMSEVRKQNQYLKEQEDATRIRGDEGQVPVARAVAEAGEEAGGDDIQRQAAQVEEARGKVGGVKESARIVTDDAGNVIPLSERFNEESPDIRFSSRLAPLESEKTVPSEEELDAELETIKLEPTWKRVLKGVGLFESPTDRIGAAGAKNVEKKLLNAYDLIAAKKGKYTKIFLDKVGNINSRKDAKLIEDYDKYMAARDNDRTAEANAILAAGSPRLRAAIEAADTVRDMQGDENIRLKTKTIDAKTRKWRPFQKLSGKSHSRGWKREVYAALRDPASNPKLFDALAQSLVDAKLINDKSEISKFVRKTFPEVSKNNFAPGMEMGRSDIRMPEMWIDYSLAGDIKAIDNIARRQALIEVFGQTTDTQKDWWDTNLDKVQNKNARLALRNLYKDLYQVREEGEHSPIMAFLNTVSTGLHLANFKTAFNNLVGGTGTNSIVFGLGNTAKAAAKVVADAKNLKSDAVGLGIINDDQMNVVRDSEGLAETALGQKLQKMASATTQGALKIALYDAAESFNRRVALVAARHWLAQGLAEYNKNAQSGKSKLFAFRMKNTFRLDLDEILKETTKKEQPETLKFYQRAVNLAQGSYRLDMVPSWLDSDVGRFFGKYQKFGTQVNRMVYEFHIRPILEAKTPAEAARAAMGAIRFLGIATASGSAVAMASALLGSPSPGPEPEDIKKAFEDGKIRRAVVLLISRAWSDLLVSGLLGQFGNIGQNIVAEKKGQRVKDIMDPPGFASIKMIQELAKRLNEQGKLTARDLDDVVQGVSAYRVNKNIAMKTLNAMGVNYSEARLTEAKEERRFARKYAEQYAKETGIEAPRRGEVARYAKTPNSPLNTAVVNALLIGESRTAQALVREALKGKNQQEKDKIISSLKSAVRSAQPIVIGGSPSNEKRMKFIVWAQRNLGKTNYDRVRRIDKDYVMSAKRAGLM